MQLLLLVSNSQFAPAAVMPALMPLLLMEFAKEMLPVTGRSVSGAAEAVTAAVAMPAWLPLMLLLLLNALYATRGRLLVPLTTLFITIATCWLLWLTNKPVISIFNSPLFL